MKILAWTTVGLTYFLMVWGNAVSSAGAGLACPDWPLCYGTITPPLKWDIVLEWGHRTIAGITSLTILALVIVLSKSRYWSDAIRRTSYLVLSLLGIQILLGGITVLLHLSITVSTIHLMIATLVLSGLLYIALRITFMDGTIKANHPKLRRYAIWGLGGLAVQMIFGGLVRHGHAGLACPDFPNCAGASFLPVSFYFETFVTFVHRWWGIVMLGLFTHVAMATWKTKLRPAGMLLLASSFVQVLLGIATVASQLHVHTRAAHAALGYALWVILFYIAVRSGTIENDGERPGVGLNPVHSPG